MRLLILLVVAWSGVVASQTAEAEEPPDSGIVGGSSNKGTIIETMGREDLATLASSYWRNPVAQGPFFDYISLSTCGDVRPGDPFANELCGESFAICERASGGGDGPALAVWRRQVNANGQAVGG